MVEWYLDGVPVKRIAREFGRSEIVVYTSLRMAGLKPSRGKGYRPPEYLPTPDEIAREAEEIRSRWPGGVQPEEEL